jgi:thiosulfate/3-mercaptopyruvate sulfurtransferase
LCGENFNHTRIHKTPVVSDFKIYRVEDIQGADVVLVDVRRLVGYREGHIPGALPLPFANMIRIRGLAFDVPSQADVERMLSERGIGVGDIIVAYDNFYGKQAARFIYTLEIYGHRRLGLLETTYGQYVRSGGRVERGGDVRRPPSIYVADPQEEKFLDKKGVMRLLEAGSHTFIDARAEADYEMGHIPGALNIPWTEIIGEAGILRPRDHLERIFNAKGLSRDRPIITYCDEGTSSALLTYALRYLGHRDVTNYYLSYGEWGSDPRTPKHGGLPRS